MPHINDSSSHSMASTLRENTFNNHKMRDDDIDGDSKPDSPANSGNLFFNNIFILNRIYLHYDYF